MEIRRFTSADAEAVLAIERASQPLPWPPARFELFSTLVAEVGRRVVGFACYSLNHATDGDETLLLANLVVAADARRQGVGRALVEARLRIGARGRVQRAMTITRHTNEPLKALYRAFNFREGARLPNYYADSDDGLVLHGALDPDAEPPWRVAPPDPALATATERLQEAMAAAEQKDYQRALEIVEDVARDEQAGVLARFYRVRLLDALGRDVEATIELERLAGETRMPFVRQALGERYLECWLVEDALPHLLAALPAAAGEANAQLWAALGTAWERLGRSREAAWAYEHVVRDAPENPSGYARLAHVRLKADRLTDALQMIEAGLRLGDESGDLHRARELALWKLGRREEARTALRRALEIDPSDRLAAVNLAALEVEAEAPRLL